MKIAIIEVDLCHGVEITGPMVIQILRARPMWVRMRIDATFEIEGVYTKPNRRGVSSGFA
jgi:hypothetical protein